MKNVHQEVLHKIRELKVESGVTPSWNESLGIKMNPTYRIPEGEMRVIFDYGHPLCLYTDEGILYISDRGIHTMLDTNKFWELFTTEFDTEIIKSFQSVVGREWNESGPLIRINTKSS